VIRLVRVRRISCFERRGHNDRHDRSSQYSKTLVFRNQRTPIKERKKEYIIRSQTHVEQDLMRIYEMHQDLWRFWVINSLIPWRRHRIIRSSIF
jgi:hypothetical protein